MTGALATRIAEDFAAAAEAADGARANDRPGAPATAESNRRRQSFEALIQRGLPTSRDENWKYVNLRPLEKVRFTPPAAHSVTPLSPTDLPAAIAAQRWVFVDGQFVPGLSGNLQQAGVTFSAAGFSSFASGARGSAPDFPNSPDLRFALLNNAFAIDGAHIEVAPRIDCQMCIELVFVATADSTTAASYPRVRVHVGSGARVGVIERHISLVSEANFINGAVDVKLDADADVQHYRIQQTGARTLYFDTLTAQLEDRARYQLYCINLGAGTARSTIHVALTGERSEVELMGVSVGKRNQTHDTLAVVEHVAPYARTRQTFRGIAAERARVAYNGKVIVRSGAHGTDSGQSMRGLLAGAEAEIDVRPQLEIYTDDVRCNHGATAGKLDENMLFYLLSRGIDRETAQRVLKWAFLEDVVARIALPELRRQIEQNLAGQLKQELL